MTEAQSAPSQDPLGNPLLTFCQTIIDHSPLPSAILTGPAYTIQCISPALAQLTTRPATDLCGRPLGECLVPWATDALLTSLAQVMASGEVQTCHHTQDHISAAGPLAWTAMLYPLPASGGSPAAIFLEVHDTSAQERAAAQAADIRDLNELLVLAQVRADETAEQLRDSLAFLQALTHSLHDGVYAIDPSGRVSYVNASAERMRGRAASDLLGQPAAEVMPISGHTLPTDPPHFWAVLHTGESAHDPDAVLRHEDGTMLPITYTLNPIRSAGQILGVVAVLHDLRALRQLEAAREEYMTLLSHDLRSPLTTILGTAELLLPPPHGRCPSFITPEEPSSWGD